MEKLWSDRGIMLTILFAGGAAIASFKLGYSECGRNLSPKTMYRADLNNDKIPDLVLRTKLKDYVFLGQEDGSFKPLEEVREHNIAKIEDEMRNRIYGANSLIECIIDKAKENIVEPK